MKVQRDYLCAHPERCRLLDAALIVRTSYTLASAIELEINGKARNARSLLGVLSVFIENGDYISVTAEGEDAAEAVRRIGAVLCCSSIRARLVPPRLQAAV